MSNKQNRRRNRRETSSTIQAPNETMREIVADYSADRPSVRSMDLEHRYDER